MSNTRQVMASALIALGSYMPFSIPLASNNSPSIRGGRLDILGRKTKWNKPHQGAQECARRYFRGDVCREHGHDFGDAVYLSPAVLTYCHRCGEELTGRTPADLEPMTDDDHAYLDQLLETEEP